MVAPLLGDVVITEIMVNPASVSDTSGEWFEIYFDKAADLNGLELGKTVGDVDFEVDDATCVEVAAGSYVLFAINGDPLTNGGLPAVDVVYSGITLSNSGNGPTFTGGAAFSPQSTVPTTGTPLDLVAIPGRMEDDIAAEFFTGSFVKGTTG